MSKIPYNSQKIGFARELRSRSTVGERRLWQLIRNRQVNGIKFKRQVAVLKYIMDFYSAEIKLAIEVDGLSHDGRQEYDRKREGELSKLGIKFVRFSEYDVVHETNDVMEYLFFVVGKLASASPRPSPILQREV